MKKYRIVSKRTKCIRQCRKISLRLKKPEWIVEIKKYDNSVAYRQKKFQENVVLCGEAIDYIASADLSETTDRNMLMRLLPQAIQILNDEERFVIMASYFNNEADVRIGKVIGKSRRRVCTIRKGALAKIRKFLETHKI